jgi:hypothetical protein
MIDTDKYEGHTEGLWKQYSLAAYHAVVLPSWKENIELILPKLADAKLIADAPLLLAEVKELQAWKAEVERICRTMNGPNRDTALFIMTNEVEEE